MEEKRRRGRPKGLPKEKLSLRLNQELLFEDLEQYAAAQGLPVGSFIGTLLHEILADCEGKTYDVSDDFIRFHVRVEKNVRGGAQVKKNASRLFSLYLPTEDVQQLDRLRTQVEAAAIAEMRQVSRRDMIALLLWDWLERQE